MKALESASGACRQRAGQHLEEAGETVGPLTAGQMGPLPRGAQEALEEAEQDIVKSAGQCSGGQCSGAQASASSAARALARAQAALALAQAGLGTQSGMPQPGQGQGQAQGQGQGQGNQPGRGQSSPEGDGRMGNWTGPGGTQGARRGTAGTSAFLGLPKRDRAAIQQSQSEKYPQEYGPLVEQYLKNLSDQSGEK
jgi:hypothetical protein